MHPCAAGRMVEFINPKIAARVFIQKARMASIESPIESANNACSFKRVYGLYRQKPRFEGQVIFAN